MVYSWGHRLEQTKNIFTVAQKRRNLIFSQIEAQKCCFVSWDYVYIAWSSRRDAKYA